jgi:hypothetical protein
MSKYPGVSAVFTNQGGKEAQIGKVGTAIPITIAGDKYGTALVKELITGPRLYARRTASPYKALPFFSNAVMTDITNVTNFVCDVPDADAKRFAVGDKVTFYDVSAGILDAGAVNEITVDIISAAGGGTGGAGFTKITCTGEVFTNTPAASDLLVLADGTQLSVNAIVVEKDIEFDGSTEFAAQGFVSGVYDKAKINNTTYFVQANNQNLELVDVQ